MPAATQIWDTGNKFMKSDYKNKKQMESTNTHIP